MVKRGRVLSILAITTLITGITGALCFGVEGRMNSLLKADKVVVIKSKRLLLFYFFLSTSPTIGTKATPPICRTSSSSPFLVTRVNT